MSETHAPTGESRETGHCTIRVKGNLDARWSAWFDGLTVQPETDGTTAIHGLVADQAALFGLLRKMRDLGLPLVSVERSEPGHPQGSPVDSH